jgi:hypothetical protein
MISPNPPEPDYLVQQIWGQLLNESKQTAQKGSNQGSEKPEESKKQLSKSFVDRKTEQSNALMDKSSTTAAPRSKSVVVGRTEEKDRTLVIVEHEQASSKELIDDESLELEISDLRISDDENPFSELERSQKDESSSKTPSFNDEIDVEEIDFKERIGIGGFAEVFKAEWRGSEVAVKKLLPMKQTKESILEFKAEVDMMRRLRHPNIVMFMGAVTKPPDICLVTELLQMSLFDLLHNTKVKLTWKIRFKIAIDTAIGMNFLHLSKPPIVHRDLVGK